MVTRVKVKPTESEYFDSVPRTLVEAFKNPYARLTTDTPSSSKRDWRSAIISLILIVFTGFCISFFK